LTVKNYENGWEAIIGMEIHAQLATETKIFVAARRISATSRMTTLVRFA
jgi:Asp-tRNA(Asn)/Glu-tRNA(Gln) amidotransferase B subunit